MKYMQNGKFCSVCIKWYIIFSDRNEATSSRVSTHLLSDQVEANDDES